MTNEQNPGADKAQAIASGDTLAAKRYAMAVLELAREHGDFEGWNAALAAIAEFMSDPEVKRVLENTRVSREPKQRLIDAALGDQPPLALNLARLLVQKNRTGLAGDISDVFRDLTEQERGVTRARATTAVPLSEAEVAALAQQLQQQTGQQVILDVDVDPAVLGGVVVQIGDKLIDASTRARLHAMRESLVGAL